MHDVLSESFIAEEAMTKYYAVTQGTSGAGYCELVDNVADEVLGFVQQTVLAGDAGERVVDVMTQGVTYAVAAAAITAGAMLKVTAAGKVTPVTTAGDIICAKARTAAGADGDWVEVEIVKSVKHA